MSFLSSLADTEFDNPVSEMIRTEKAGRELEELFYSISMNLQEMKEYLITIRMLAQDSKVRSDNYQVVENNSGKIIKNADVLIDKKLPDINELINQIEIKSIYTDRKFRIISKVVDSGKRKNIIK